MKIKETLILCEFAPNPNKNTARNTKDYSATSRKRGRCQSCNRGRDIKTQIVCKPCALYACKNHINMTICDACRIQDAEDDKTE